MTYGAFEGLTAILVSETCTQAWWEARMELSDDSKFPQVGFLITARAKRVHIFRALEVER